MRRPGPRLVDCRAGGLDEKEEAKRRFALGGEGEVLVAGLRGGGID